jgi:hypothetical protein
MAFDIRTREGKNKERIVIKTAKKIKLINPNLSILMTPMTYMTYLTNLTCMTIFIPISAPG